MMHSQQLGLGAMCQKALVNACGHVSVFSWRLTFLWLVGCILRLFILFPFRYVSLCLSVCLSVPDYISASLLCLSVPAERGRNTEVFISSVSFLLCLFLFAPFVSMCPPVSLRGSAENDGLEDAGHENDRPSCKTWNCTTWNYEIAGCKNAFCMFCSCVRHFHMLHFNSRPQHYDGLSFLGRLLRVHPIKPVSNICPSVRPQKLSLISNKFAM